MARNLLGGSEQAFDEFVEAYRSKLFQYSYLMCGHREDAEEVAQETLMKVFQSLDQLREPERLKPWVLRRANPMLKGLPGVDNRNDPLIHSSVHRIDRVDNDIWSGGDASRRFSFGTRLRVTTPDFMRVLEIDPDFLKALPAK